MNIIGLDLSLTATGVATREGSFVLGNKARGMARLQWLRDQIAQHAQGADVAIIEGYSFGSNGAHAHAGAELGGVVRLMLYEAGVRVIDVAPGTLKKFATGKGNADKDTVLSAAIRAGYEGSNNNGADAWWLREMARYPAGAVAETQYRDEATKVAFKDWPFYLEGAA